MSFACRPNWSVGAVSLADIPSTIQDDAVDPANASVQLDLDENGEGSYDQFGGAVSFSWFSPNSLGIGAGYWVRMTVNSGTTPSGSSTGSWLSLATARTWTLTRTSVGTTTANVTVAIATDSGGSNVVATRTFTMTAFVDV